MGNANSSRTAVSAKTRKEREIIRTQRVQQNVVKMDHYTQQWIQEKSTQLAAPDSMQQVRMLVTARDQIQRGDRPLTKADLTAILLRLQPHIPTQEATRIYQDLTSRDLIILIREIIYDPITTTMSSANSLALANIK